MVFIVFAALVYANVKGEHKRYQPSASQCRLPQSTGIQDRAKCIKAWQVAYDSHTDITPKVASYKVGEPTCGYNHEEQTLYFASKSTTNPDEGATLWDYLCDFGDSRIEIEPDNVVFIVIFSIFMRSVAQVIEWMFPVDFRPPHTVMLFLLGMIFAAIGFAIEASDPTNLYVRFVNSMIMLDAFHIFWVFLPPLLFEDASLSNWHVLFRLLPNCLLIAVPGVVINTCFTASVIFGLFSDTGDESNELTLLSCFLLGSILSATDPVAVIGTLHGLHAPDKLSTLIAGEALLNDGTAVVMFRIFFDAARGSTTFSFGSAVLLFLRLGVGGVLFGLLCSLVLHGALNLTKHMFTTQALLVFFFIYFSFYVSELSFIDVSGVLVVVTLGFYMSAVGKYRIDADRLHELHGIISFISTLFNESIFVLAGIISFRFITKHIDVSAFNPLQDGIHWAELALLYLIIHVSRAITVAILWPLLVRSGYGLRSKEAIILIFGGLRGAVGLSLGLIVDLDRTAPALPSSSSSRIAFHVSGITLLTLLFNGTVIGKLYKSIHVYKHAAYHDALFTRALAASELDVKRRVIEDLKQNWFFHNSFFDIAQRAIPELHTIMEPQDGVFGARKERLAKSGVARPFREHLGKMVSKILRRAHKDPATFDQRFFKKLKQTHPSAHKNFLCKMFVHANSERQAALKTAILASMGLPYINFEREDDSQTSRIRALSAQDMPSRPDPRVLRQSLTQALTTRRSRSDFGPAEPLVRRKVPTGVNGDGETTNLHENGVYYCGLGPDTEFRRCNVRDGQCETCEFFQQEIEHGAVAGKLPPLTDIQRARAAKNWKRVRERVWQYAKLVREANARDQPPPQLERGDSILDDDGVINKVLEDEETVAEVYQTIMNAAHARLTEMFERRSIHVHTYKRLLSCLDHGEEAIAGELRPYGFLSHKNGDASLRDLHKKTHAEQLSKCFDVIWASLNEHLRSSTYFSSVLSKYIPVRVRELVGTETPLIHAWHRVRRNMEMLLTYIFVFEQLLLDLSVFFDFPKIRVKVKLLVTLAKANHLHNLEKDNRELFIIAEHLFCMKCIILLKKQVLEEYVTLGVIQLADYTILNKRYLIPSLQELNRFVPSAEHMLRHKTKLRIPLLSAVTRRFDVGSPAATAAGGLHRHRSSSRMMTPSEALAGIRSSAATISSPPSIFRQSMRPDVSAPASTLREAVHDIEASAHLRGTPHCQTRVAL